MRPYRAFVATGCVIEYSLGGTEISLHAFVTATPEMQLVIRDWKYRNVLPVASTRCS